MKKEKEISIIIPAYNEERNIESTLAEIDERMSSSSLTYKIIVVDDGSTDKTAKLVRKLNIKNLKLISFPKNKGKGRAVKAGMLASRGKWRLQMDADNSTKIEELFNFLEHTDKFDIIIGSRVLPESKIIKRQPFYRILMGRLGSFLTRRILKIEQKDTQCGFKLFSKEAAEKIFPKTISEGWALDFEVLFLAKKAEFKVKEVPVTWSDDRVSSVKIPNYLETLGELFTVREVHCPTSEEGQLIKTGLQFCKFCIVGVINTTIDFFVFNLLIFIFGIGSALSYFVIRSIAFLIGVTNSFFWNKNWVFKKYSSEKTKKEAFLFFLIAIVGFTLNGIVSTLAFVNLSHYLAYLPEIINANLGALVGLVFVVLWDFWGYKMIVFKK